MSIASALREVEQARAELRDPSADALRQCAGRLERAISLVSAAGQQRGELRALSGARQLRRSLAGLAKLAARPAAYYEGWRNRLGEMTAGYRPGGESGEQLPVKASRVSITG